MATTKLLCVRLGLFPSLWTPSNVNGEGPLKFSANLVMAKDSPAAKLAQAGIDTAAIAKWGAKGPTIAKALARDKKSLRNGDENLDKSGEIYSGFEGMLYVVAKSKVRPTILDQNKAPVSEESGLIYAGCWVNAHVEFYAMDKPGQGKGVFATLTGIQKVKDGDAFGAGRPADPEEFDELSTEEAPDYA